MLIFFPASSFRSERSASLRGPFRRFNSVASGKSLLAHTDRKIGGWWWTDTHTHTHKGVGGGGNLSPSLHCSHISEKRRNYFTHRLIKLCVRQKSLSESNLSRSARVAPDKQRAVPSRCSLLENTTSAWLTGGGVTDPPASNGLIINVGVFLFFFFLFLFLEGCVKAGSLLQSAFKSLFLVQYDHL